MINSIPSRLVYSDENLIKHGQAWPDVPLILIDGLLAFEASEWVLDLKIRGCSKHTLVSYATSVLMWLRAMAVNELDWRSAGNLTAERFMAVLAREGASCNTIRLRMVHIQEFYRWAFNAQKILAIPFHIQGGRRSLAHAQLGAKVKLPGKTSRRVKPHNKETFDKVLAQTQRKAPALILRDELIAEAGRYMGLRRSEISELRVDQFATLDPNDDLHVIEIISAKSGRTDSVLVPRLYVKKVQDYISIHRAIMISRLKKYDEAYHAPANIFLNERGKFRGQAITPRFISETWKRSANEAGIDSRFHDNRSSFATNAAKAAREQNENARAVVKELLRHKSESTGDIYVAFDEIQSTLLARARIVNDGYDAKE